MEFLVMGEEEIKKYHTNKIHIIISISSPKTLKAVIPRHPLCLDILYLSFHDLDGIHMPSPATNIKLFSKNDAQKIINFVMCYTRNAELIICQCEAGISRSAGVAGALSKIMNGDDTRIFKNYLPNRLVYRTILNEAQGELK